MNTSVCRPFQAARDAGAALFVLNGSDVVSEVVGDSEAGMKGAAPPAKLEALSNLIQNSLKTRMKIQIRDECAVACCATMLLSTVHC
jgi:hypothetical protein